MKVKSILIASFAAVVAFAVAVPDVGAKPPSKTPGMLYQNKKRKSFNRTATPIFSHSKHSKKTIGLSVKKQGRKGATRRSWRGFRKGRGR